MQESVAQFWVIAHCILSLDPYEDYSSRSVCVLWKCWMEGRRRRSRQSESCRRTGEGAVVWMDVIGWSSRITSEHAPVVECSGRLCGSRVTNSMCYITCKHVKPRMNVNVRGCARSSDLDGYSQTKGKDPEPKIPKNWSAIKHPQNWPPKFKKRDPKLGEKSTPPTRGPRVSCLFFSLALYTSWCTCGREQPLSAPLESCRRTGGEHYCDSQFCARDFRECAQWKFPSVKGEGLGVRMPLAGSRWFELWCVRCLLHCNVPKK